MITSLCIHGLFFALFYWFVSAQKADKNTSFVSLINSQNSQSSRLKKVKGSITNEGKTESELSEKGDKPSKLKGKDKEDVEERFSSQASNTTPAFMTYAQELQNFIEKNQYYPRRALVMGQEGEVQMRFKINRDGQFSNIEIQKKTQYEILNNAAFDLIVSLKSFKPLPKEYRGQGEFIIPIRYQVVNQ